MLTGLSKTGRQPEFITIHAHGELSSQKQNDLTRKQKEKTNSKTADLATEKSLFLTKYLDNCPKSVDSTPKL